MKEIETEIEREGKREKQGDRDRDKERKKDRQRQSDRGSREEKERDFEMSVYLRNCVTLPTVPKEFQHSH